KKFKHCHGRLGWGHADDTRVSILVSTWKPKSLVETTAEYRRLHPHLVLDAKSAIRGRQIIRKLQKQLAAITADYERPHPTQHAVQIDKKTEIARVNQAIAHANQIVTDLKSTLDKIWEGYRSVMAQGNSINHSDYTSRSAGAALSALWQLNEV